MEPKTLFIRGKCSTIELCPQGGNNSVYLNLTVSLKFGVLPSSNVTDEATGSKKSNALLSCPWPRLEVWVMSLLTQSVRAFGQMCSIYLTPATHPCLCRLESGSGPGCSPDSQLLPMGYQTERQFPLITGCFGHLWGWSDLSSRV